MSEPRLTIDAFVDSVVADVEAFGACVRRYQAEGKKSFLGEGFVGAWNERRTADEWRAEWQAYHQLVESDQS